MSPRQKVLLGDRLRRDAHAAVCATHPEHQDDTIDRVLVLVGADVIAVKYRDVTRYVRLGDLEVIDEPLDKDVKPAAMLPVARSVVWG
ncbi:MAG: hypothetical protein ACEQSX_12870 [Baekduiaceae bacterium]